MQCKVLTGLLYGASVCHRAKFHQNRPNSCRDIAIKRPPSWIRWARICTTHNEYLVVSVIEQNLIAIDAVVFITCDFQYFARYASKMPIYPKSVLWR